MSMSAELTALPAAARALAIEPASYVAHPLHSPERIWAEKNCYVDIWIELVNALGLEPTAMMAFTLGIDFEGDQWTFFKPPHEDLKRLFGIDVQELYIWRPLLEHALEHLSAGKLISTEADAYWLPDTVATDYRRKHTKTTIVLASVDLAAQQLGYFHNGGYFLAEGEDFARLFRLNAAPDPTFLPFLPRLSVATESNGTMGRPCARYHAGACAGTLPGDRAATRFLNFMSDSSGTCRFWCATAWRRTTRGFSEPSVSSARPPSCPLSTCGGSNPNLPRPLPRMRC